MGCQIILISLLVALSIYTINCAQYSRGYESRVAWQNNHVLMNNRNVPRSISYRIDYGMTMRQVPLIMINPNIYDWEWGNPVNWLVEVSSVDRTGFTYTITANAQKSIYTIFFNWMAITGEDSLQIKYYKFNTPNLANKRPDETMRVNFEFEHEATPLVWTTFVGQSFTEGTKWKIYQDVSKIDTQGFTYTLSTNGESKLDWVAVAVLSISPDRAYLINGPVYKNNQNINFNGDFVYEFYTITDEFRKKGNPPEPFSAIKGFAVSSDRNMRLQCQRDVWEPNIARQKLRLGRWADTRLDELQYTQFVYTASQDKCAKFYTECSFQGEEAFVLCEENDNSIAAELHGNNIRSIKVPKGLVVKVYERENFEGKQKIFDKDQPCVKEWKW